MLGKRNYGMFVGGWGQAKVPLLILVVVICVSRFCALYNSSDVSLLVVFGCIFLSILLILNLKIDQHQVPFFAILPVMGYMIVFFVERSLTWDKLPISVVDIGALIVAAIFVSLEFAMVLIALQFVQRFKYSKEPYKSRAFFCCVLILAFVFVVIAIFEKMIC